MIREALTVLALLLVPSAALAAEDEAGPPAAGEQRMPFEKLAEHALGTASRSVRYDWRKSTVALGVLGSHLSELNNFQSARLGALARTPLGGFFGEIAASYVWTWDTPSSTQLARTPYRQWGRPDRVEVDANFNLPLAEGVVTAWPSFFPAAELMLSGTAGLRYLFYPGARGGESVWTFAKTLLAPRLTDLERDNLEDNRNASMAIDPARYGLMLGLTTDLYSASGLFVSPRVMFAVPLMGAATDTHLRYWWELSIAAGLSL